MAFETTVGNVGGSFTTVIPLHLAKLKKIKKGDKIKWIADITEKGIVITLETV